MDYIRVPTLIDGKPRCSMRAEDYSNALLNPGLFKAGLDQRCDVDEI